MKPKFLLLIVLSAIIFTGLIGAITFQNIFPTTTPYITNESTVNLSYGIHAGDGLSSITHSWNGTNTTLIDNSTVMVCNMDNRSELGENDTQIVCWSPNGDINGTVVGGENISWTANGKYGGAFNFSGNKNYINYSVLSQLNYSNNYSISLWLKVNHWDSSETIIADQIDASNKVFRLGVEGGKIIRMNLYNASTSVGFDTPTNSFTGNTWFNLVVIVDNSNKLIHFFVNNINVSTKSTLNTNPTVIGNGRMLTLGTSRGTTPFFNGTIDELLIFNKTLSASEVDYLYNSNIQKYNSSYYEYNITKNLSIYFRPTSFLCSINLTRNEFCSTSQTLQEKTSLVSNFSNSIGVINNYFYGTNGYHFSQYSYASGSLADYEWGRNSLLNAKINTLRINMNLNTLSFSNRTFRNELGSNLNNIDVYKDLVSYAKINNITILFIANGMPLWLSSNQTEWCKDDNETCPPSNYSRWGLLVTDFLQEVNCDANTCEVEVWNEPDLTTWMKNVSVTNVNKSIEYNKLFNTTYTNITNIYPNMKVFGGVVSSYSSAGGSLILDNFISNFSYLPELFVSYHQYTNLDFKTYISGAVSAISTKCSSAGANCAKIINSEFNVYNSTIQNNSFYSNIHSEQIALGYLSVLNINPTNYSMYQYKWTTSSNVSLSEYPYIWNMVSQEGIDKYTVTFYPPYNVTKNFAHLCPSGATVYVSSNDDSSIKQVSCKKGNMYSLIVINTATTPKNITLNMSMENGTVIFPYASLRSYEDDDTIYKVTDGITQLGVLDSYEVLYLVGDGQAPTITITSPTGSVINVVNYWFNVTLDEEGSWCGYSINGGTNVTMTQQGVLSQFKYLANIPNGFNIVTFYCNDTYGNMATASTYITGLTPSGAGTGDVPEIPTTENEDGSSEATVLTWWDKIVADLTTFKEDVKQELFEKNPVTGEVIDKNSGEKTFMEKYIWVFIGLFLFMILVLAGRKGRI